MFLDHALHLTDCLFQHVQMKRVTNVAEASVQAQVTLIVPPYPMRGAAIDAIKGVILLTVRWTATPPDTQFYLLTCPSACPNGNAKTYGAGRSKSSTGGGANSTDECFKCGQKGHWSSSVFISPFLSLPIIDYDAIDCPKGSGSSKPSKRSYSSNSSGTAKREKGGSRGKKKSAFGAADDW